MDAIRLDKRILPAFCQSVLLNYLANISLIKRYGCMAEQSPLFVHSNQMRKQTRITQISMSTHKPFDYAVFIK